MSLDCNLVNNGYTIIDAVSVAPGVNLTNGPNGTIELQGNAPLVSSGSTFINQGAVVGGAGAVLNISGGTLTPASTTSAVNLALTAGSTLDWQIGGPNPGTGYDQITVGTSATLAGNLQLELVYGFKPTLNEQFTLLHNLGANAISGQFANLAEGGVITVSGNQFQITYLGGTNHNDVVFTVIGVPNTPPVANAGGPYTMTYGGGLTLNASGSSDPDGDPLTYSWTINGHANATSGATPTLSWSQLQALGITSAQPFSVSVQVNDGAFITSQSASVTVNMATPTIVWAAPADITYGTPLGNAQLDAAASALVNGSTVSVTGAFVYTPGAGAIHAGNNQALSVTFTPSDSLDYNTAMGGTTINVLKAHVTVSADAKSRPYGAADPAFAATLTGFQNGETLATSGVTGAAGFSSNDTPTSPVGSYVITPAQGSLAAANYDFITFNTGVLTVTKRALNVVVSPNPATINEGQTATVTVTVTDTSGSALVNVDPSGTISLSTSGPLALSTNSATLTGNGSGVSTCVVTVTGRDNPGGTVTATFAGDAIHLSGMNSGGLTVNNVAPTVGAITAPAAPQPVNTTVSVSASFTDPGILDTHTAVWNWGDGTPTNPDITAGVVSEANGSGSVTGGHTYTAAGVYSPTLTVTDKDGGVGQSTFQYVVIYDPSGGFVTGGGWINSPAGADVANPTLTGKASFGFDSRYKKGASVPTGNTQFNFKVANLDFHSTSYDWLVVAGAKAQYKGSGQINGAGNDAFMLTAVDGALPGGHGQDTFRIKIWDKNTGTTIYDNQLALKQAYPAEFIREKN